ncbi:MAG: pentapeptide repeat-containing protein [Candidatus Electrothrix sp. YB6]
MKQLTNIFVCGALLCCCTAVAAESSGSSAAKVQKNVNRLIRENACPLCDLHGAVLVRMDLSGADLQGADLSGAKLHLADCSGADLRNTNLRGAALGGADFASADLRGADLTGAQLAGAYLQEAVLDSEIPKEQPYIPESAPEPVVPSDKTSGGTTGKNHPAQASRQTHAAAPADDRRVQKKAVKDATEAQPVFFPAPTVRSEGSTDSEKPVRTGRTMRPSPEADRQQEKKSEQPIVVHELLHKKSTTVAPKDLAAIQEAVIPAAAEPDESELTAAPQQGQLEEKSVGTGSERPKIPKAAESEKEAVQEPAGRQGKVEGNVTYTAETLEQSREKQQALVDKLLDEQRCVACDLAGADLRGAKLKKADLERADLQGADLEEADLRQANLKGTKWTGANLKKADLRKADLYLADFTGADLTEARLDGALVDSADFTGAIGVNLKKAVR